VDDLTSRGTFYTDGLNLAAAFGPVRGLKGRVTFSDLLNLTTEPDQVFDIGSINPGIEVLAGRIVFSMREGTQIDVKDGRWPFMGGELIMRPVRLRYGTDDEQRYTFEMIALDAAKFVTQMELNNLGATGTFDGTVPIVFDAMGNGRIEHGLLISRVPGGNVSYIGDLLYEDMGAISNYAFQSLRSLDYRQMSVELDGDLAGEIVTKFQFDGVRQGEGASQNFVTRELAQLPIRFRVNVRSENFYELATMVRTFWDTSALPDPIDQGLLEARDGRFVRPPSIGAPQKTPPDEPRTAPDQSALRPDDELPVQAPESEDHL
ncbi:MAG: YdbH domain-containing protein, partial [Pseudomonadota bacterium]